ncbi:hypothetical protein JCM3765_007189 [Sporobolomyces pararoseus]
MLEAKIHLLSRQIDRLSNLPNELLDSIFDFAYTLHSPPTGPLSKRLLPWFVSGLYRRIKLSKGSNIVKLVKKINSHPHLGALVESLALVVRHWEPNGSSIPLGMLNNFFHNLTRLVRLELEAKWSSTFDNLIDDGLRSISSTNLPSLIHLTIPGDFFLHSSASFSALVSLRIFHLTLHERHLSSHLKQYGGLPSLLQLSIEGIEGDSHAVVSICSLAPKLRDLSLETSQSDFNYVLSLLPTTLSKLELVTSQSDPAARCDGGLSRFIHLERLHLGDYLYSRQLSSYITHLRDLQTITLGIGKLSVSEFLPLLSGQTRLPNLSRLQLNLVRDGKVGYRLFVDAEGSAGGRWVPGDGRLTGGDWVVPEFEDGEEGDFTYENVKELVRVAEEEGIEVVGSMSGAFEIYSSYLLEIANLAIYRSFRDKDLRHIRNLQAERPHLCSRLPSLDLEALDPTNLKIVKLDLPAEEWFSLSLEN